MIKTNRWFTICTSILLLLLFTSFPITSTGHPPSIEGKAANGQPVVVCTTTVLGIFVESIAGDLVNVTTLVQPGICPAHFDVKPSHVYAVSIASLVLYHGFEPWLQGLIEASGNTGVTQVQVSGPWNTPQAGLSYAKRVTDALMSAFPGWNSTFTANNATLTAAINKASDEIRQDAEALNPSNYNVTCMQWQASFVEWYGFNVAVTYGPPETLSTADVLSITQASLGNHSVLVIDNMQSGTSFGAQLAAEIGAVHVVLSNFPGAIPGTANYTDLLRYNAEQLKTGINTYTSLQGQIGGLLQQLQSAQTQVLLLGATTLMLAIVAVVEGVLLYRRRPKPAQ